MDNKSFTCAVFIDLAKAFDTVDHNILLKKLYIYGVRGCVCDCISDRTQTTSIDDYISDKHVIEYGVPQGSVLGPLLFLLYINDINKCSKVLKFHLFADDTNVSYSNRNVKDLERVLNNEQTKLKDWFIANKLTNRECSLFMVWREGSVFYTAMLSILHTIYTRLTHNLRSLSQVRALDQNQSHHFTLCMDNNTTVHYSSVQHMA